jgi:hypothetical protein
MVAATRKELEAVKREVRNLYSIERGVVNKCATPLLPFINIRLNFTLQLRCAA